MKIDVRDNIRYIMAENGNFLTNSEMTIYGIEIVLGDIDSPDNYQERPLSEYPVIEETVETIDTIDSDNEALNEAAEEFEALLIMHPELLELFANKINN